MINVLIALMLWGGFSYGANDKKSSQKNLKSSISQNELNKDLDLALYASNFEKSERLLKLGAEVNAMDSNTPIFFNVIPYRDEYTGQYSENEYKLNPEIKFKDHEESISKAESSDSLKMIDLIFKNGARFNLSDNFGSTIFDKSVRNGHLNAIKKIYELGGRPSDSKEIALDSAAQGNLDVLKYLFSIGYGLQSKDVALLAALRKGNNKIAKYLLSTGANPNYEIIKDSVRERDPQIIYDKAYETPLTLAISTGNNEMIEVLLEAGAKVETSDLKETPLMLAVKNVMILPNIVSRLAALTRQINTKNSDGDTALHLAFERDDSIWESDGGECGTEFPRQNKTLTKRSQDVVLLLLKNGVHFEKEWLKERIAKKRWDRKVFANYLDSSKID